jgi:hypothetical protein
VFLPDEHAAGYGEHCTDPDSKAAEKKCYCDVLYGSQKPWGCGWFKIWTENVRRAVKLNHKLQVYFFCGVVGEGTVRWDHLREHGRLCDAILDGVTAEERNHILSTELFPFDGLGQSQKGEVAWLEKNGYDFEMLDIGPFLLGARIMSVGNILPASLFFSGGTSGHQCVVSMPMSAYFHINEQIVQPLVEEGALSFAGVFAPPQTPYHGKHWMVSDTECYCKQLQDPFGCLYFAKWINNVERAKANGHELLVCYGHGMKGKGKAPSWDECEETTRKYDRFLFRRKRFLADLPRPEQARLEKLSHQLRDEFSGEKRGSERGDEEQRLFAESLSAVEREQLASFGGLGRAQRAEVAWLDMKGIKYTEVDIVEWARQCAEPGFVSKPVDSPVALYTRTRRDRGGFEDSGSLKLALGRQSTAPAGGEVPKRAGGSLYATKSNRTMLSDRKAASSTRTTDPRRVTAPPALLPKDVSEATLTSIMTTVAGRKSLGAAKSTNASYYFT